MVRVTLTGPELAGFTSAGPADHLKVFFPDPATGILTLPEIGPDGMRRGAEGVVISRDYTPRAFRPSAHGGELDLDIVTHGVEGPASAWAELAKVGDDLGIAGPRGSRLVPEGVERLLVVADETALPAVGRWLELLPAGVPVTALLHVVDATVESYFDAAVAERMDAEWITHADGRAQLEESLRSLGRIGSGTFVFLAGEADMLVPLRRYLRHELFLPAGSGLGVGLLAARHRQSRPPRASGSERSGLTPAAASRRLQAEFGSVRLTLDSCRPTMLQEMRL